MSRLALDPILIEAGVSRRLHRLRRVHEEFDEAFLQELLVQHPALLPVQSLREDVGDLLCIGREVVAGESGSIDNLYLSAGGYPVLVETKLWRNPEARREVLAQVLDYTKDLVGRDFAWFERQWAAFAAERKLGSDSLVDRLSSLADDEIDEPYFVDRVNRALTQGDILLLVVGDGIETRLQRLVDHLCRQSSRLRYSLALLELACYQIARPSTSDEILVVPRLIGAVEPVQRAYVRVDVHAGAGQDVEVQSVVEQEQRTSTGYKRSFLTEDEWIRGLDAAVGQDSRAQVEAWVRALVEELDLEADFKSYALMLKIPDPAGEKPGASVLAIGREGTVYNPDHLLRQLRNMGLENTESETAARHYWQGLRIVDDRFGENGISHKKYRLFIPLGELVGVLGDIRTEIEGLARKARQALEL